MMTPLHHLAPNYPAVSEPGWVPKPRVMTPTGEPAERPVTCGTSTCTVVRISATHSGRGDAGDLSP